jgi:PAS domain S-box-containing protein
MVAEVRANTNKLSASIADAELRKLADNIPTICWIADADGYITWYNRGWYDYTGTTPAQMEGWGWQSVHDLKDLSEALERWSEGISTRQAFEMVIPIKGADGLFRPFLTRISPTLDAHGDVSNWFGVNTDISLRPDADGAFAKSEARFRALADAMPQMVWSASPLGFLDYFNARWYEFTGAPIGSCDGDAWSAMLHPDDRAAVMETWRSAIATGAPAHSEFRLRHRSGDYRWVLGRAQPEQDSIGEVARWYGSWTDIDDIVAARQILKRSRDELEAEVIARTGERNLLATLVETTDVMIMALDLRFDILALNKSAADECQRVFGVRPHVGENLLALLADQPEQRAAAEYPWRRALEGEEFTVVESHGHPSRARAHYEMKFRTLRNSQGERIGAFQFVVDVSDRLRDQAMLAQAQEALRQSQKLEAMGQLTGGVAHDFNNLLTPIIGTLDILKRRAVGGAREQRLIHGAFESAERARVLVHRLLAFARRQPLQSVAVDVGGLITGLAGLVASTTGPQVTLTIDVAENLPPAKADPGQLEMAIINLALNSRDAMDGVGSIALSATLETHLAGKAPPLAPGRYVCIRVADSGRGMDEAVRARAIEPFFSTKGIGKGTGLGLSMAHGLASQLGGALTIDSAPGAGTTVAMWLPLADEAPQPALQRPAGEAVADPAGAQRGETVLVVEDEEYIRVSTVDMLTELGFNVRDAPSAEAALAAIKAGLRPDILITDHLMPGMTGVQLAHAVRQLAPQTRILIVSGFAETDGIDASLPRLTKPFVQGDLARFIAGG